MDDERLQLLLTCAIETVALNQFKNKEPVEKWSINKKGRRISFLALPFFNDFNEPLE